MFVRHKILRIGPKGLWRAPYGPWCQLKAGTLASAGRRPAYMLVQIIISNKGLFLNLAEINISNNSKINPTSWKNREK